MRRRLVSLATVTCLVSGLMSVGNGAALADGSLSGVTVTLVSPSIGVALNPDLPFTITLDITGGSLASANHCYDPALSGFHFGAEEIDGNNYGQTLGWVGDAWHSTDGTLSSAWTTKLLPNGLECSLAVPTQSNLGSSNWSQNLALADTAWFSTRESTWSGSATNYGAPTKVDIAWTLDGGPVQHHVFNATQVGTPSITILGLSRGDIINYEKGFQIQATMSAALPFVYLSANQNTVSQDDRVLSCDKQNIVKAVSDSLATYTVNCVLRLWNYFTASVGTIDIGSSLSADKYYQGPTVTVSVGKVNVPQIELFGSNASHASGAQYVGSNSKKPWVPPGLFTLQGDICVPKDTNCDSTADYLSNVPVKICANTACVNVITDSSGTFSYSHAFVTQSVDWTLDATYNGVPVYSGADPLGEQSDHSAAGTSALPQQPPKPLTTAQIKAIHQSMYNYGVKLMNSLTSVELVRIGFLGFFLPGQTKLGPAAAQDFCWQLPRVILNLAYRVGSTPDQYFVKGCATAAMKIKVKN